MSQEEQLQDLHIRSLSSITSGSGLPVNPLVIAHGPGITSVDIGLAMVRTTILPCSLYELSDEKVGDIQ